MCSRSASRAHARFQKHSHINLNYHRKVALTLGFRASPSISEEGDGADDGIRMDALNVFKMALECALRHVYILISISSYQHFYQ